jgi:MoxR-like ATPase
MESVHQAEVNDSQLVEKLRLGHHEVLKELRKVIIAQDAVVEQVMISLLVGGHSMITGVPGLAKTLLIKTLAQILDLSFKRIQFTPDLMPADITGTDIIQEDVSTGKRELIFVKGPIFANILLADEINRTPPKTQAALLEAMEELQVTVQGVTYSMERPFFVLATQNPIELEGTYPLPEAQLDRFMFNIVIDYLNADDEHYMVTTTTAPQDIQLERTVTGADIEIGRASCRERVYENV